MNVTKKIIISKPLNQSIEEEHLCLASVVKFLQCFSVGAPWKFVEYGPSTDYMAKPLSSLL